MNLSFYHKENKKDLPSGSAIYYPITVGLPSIEVLLTCLIQLFYRFDFFWKKIEQSVNLIIVNQNRSLFLYSFNCINVFMVDIINFIVQILFEFRNLVDQVMLKAFQQLIAFIKQFYVFFLSSLNGLPHSL